MPYRFDLTPVSKPRMTKRDQWRTNPNHPDPNRRQRPSVTQWFAFQRALQLLANTQRFKPSDEMRMVFYLPMPKSWSKVKRATMNGKPHQGAQDIDNLTKAMLDSLLENDCTVWHVETYKYWTDQRYGYIEVEHLQTSQLILDNKQIIAIPDKIVRGVPDWKTEAEIEEL